MEQRDLQSKLKDAGCLSCQSAEQETEMLGPRMVLLLPLCSCMNRRASMPPGVSAPPLSFALIF